MVHLDQVSELVRQTVQQRELVAVFFGGTSGIGHYTLRALARETTRHSGRGFRAYIVGRNAVAAEAIIAECRQICEKGSITFIRVEDLSLLREVDAVCAEIVRLEESQHGQAARIDYLMLSQGGSIFLPRIDTDEGLDKTMSLMYYSRMRAILQLWPLLARSSTFHAAGASVVSVYAAGIEKKLFPEDLSLRDPKRYSYAQARSHMVYMHTLFMESLAKLAHDQDTDLGEMKKQSLEKERIAYTHVFPGLVLGPTFQSPEMPAWFRFVFRWIFKPLFAWFVCVPPEECGSRMLSYLSSRYPAIESSAGDILNSQGKIGVCEATNGRVGGGTYALDAKGDSVYKAGSYDAFDKEDMRGRIWGHTMSAVETIAAGKVFVG